MLTEVSKEIGQEGDIGKKDMIKEEAKTVAENLEKFRKESALKDQILKEFRSKDTALSNKLDSLIETYESNTLRYSSYHSYFFQHAILILLNL